MSINQLLKKALAYRYGINTHMDITKSIGLFKQLVDQGCSISHYELAKLYAHHFCTNLLPFNRRKRDEHLLEAIRLGNINAIIKLLSFLRGEMSIYDCLYYPNKNLREEVVKEIYVVVEQLIEQGSALALIIKGAFIEDCTPQSVSYLYDAWLKGEKFFASLYLSKTDDEFLRQYKLENSVYWEEQNRLLLPDFMNRFEDLFIKGDIQQIHEFVYGDLARWFDHESSVQLQDWLQQFYQMQAEEGCSDAWLHCTMDDERIIEYLEKAANLGNPVGAYQYAYTLEQGEHVSNEQSDQIKEYYRIAAQAEHPNALYEYGRYFIDDDFELALRYFKHSATLDCPQAYLILADLTDHEEQVQWADQALRHDEFNDFIIKLLHKAYAEGYVVQQDQERADYLKFVMDANQYWDNLLAQPLEQAIEKFNEKLVKLRMK